MYNTVVRLELYKKISGDDVNGYVYATTPVLIDGFDSLTANSGIENIKDSINFNFKNQYTINSLDGTKEFSFPTNIDFSVRDLIKVYAYDQPMTGTLSDHLLMIAYIKSVSEKCQEGKASISVTCFNRMEVLLNSFMFAPYNEGTKVPKMIVDSINKIKNHNQNDRVDAYMDFSGNAVPGDKAAYDSEGILVPGKAGYIRAYKKAAYNDDGTLKFGIGSPAGETVPTILDDDGNPIYFFNDATFTEVYKPFIQHLESLSDPKYTGDEESGTYISYLDTTNNLHWGPKNLTNVSSKTGTENILNEYDSPSIGYSRDNDEVINAVIVNAGTDPNQNGILSLRLNPTSMGLYGAKWKYIAKVDIAEKVRQDELESGTWTNDDGETLVGINSPKSIGENNYPSGYPWIINTTESDPNGNWTYVAGTTEVTSNSEYKEYYRRVCKRMGEKAGEKITKYSDEPIIKVDYELEQGSNNYTSGDMVQVKLQSLNLGLSDDDITYLRIMSIQHQFQNGRWLTKLSLKQDRDFDLLS